MFDPSAIVVHCSASQWGDASVIDEWHRARGFDGIGYHGVVLNGIRKWSSPYSVSNDGRFEPGRPESKQGAHCLAGGMNRIALGICLIGAPGFKPTDVPIAPEWCFKGLLKRGRERIAYCSAAQFNQLVGVCAEWCVRYGIDPKRITQHSDHDRGKPLCASLNVGYLRKRVVEEMER